jgi:hypothetical protein
MSEEFDGDLARCRADLDTARAELLGVLSSVTDNAIDSAPRGHWPPRRILEHVIWHEQVYVRFIASIRGAPIAGQMPDYTPASVDDARRLLSESRAALLAGVEGVDEDTFYRLTRLGFEEYSIVSMLENEANHEREHGDQITKTLSSL